MNKLFTIIIISLLLIGCNNEKEELPMTGPLIGVWENLNYESKVTDSNLEHRFIKFEYTPELETNMLFLFRNKESEKWTFIGYFINETKQTMSLSNYESGMKYEIEGDILTIYSSETYSYKKVDN